METDFATRNKSRIGEPKAMEYLERRQTRFMRFGLDALDTDYPIWKIPSPIRSAPDWIIFNDYDEAFFFEAKTFRGEAKFKIHDMKNYRRWNNDMPIIFFLYDIGNKAFCEVTFNELTHIIVNNKLEIRSFPENENNRYYSIPISILPDFTNF